ncbi:MAG: hypothetical protein IH859_10325 [Chloroflexi bacterium]|nr:hypothetical protein [Chloroflexota bacterium]
MDNKQDWERVIELGPSIVRDLMLLDGGHVERYAEAAAKNLDLFLDAVVKLHIEDLVEKVKQIQKLMPKDKWELNIPLLGHEELRMIAKKLLELISMIELPRYSKG